MQPSNEPTSSTQLVQILRVNTLVALNLQSDLGAIRQAILNLDALFRSITGFTDDPFAKEQYTDTILPSGKALSPPNAAQCLTDFLRAARFLQGIQAALQEAQRRFPGQCIEVLYAGSGPFAPLVLPLMSLFEPGSVKFTILDIHPSSIASVTALVDAFRFSAFVRALVVSDATTYQHHSEQSLHVIVVETMQRALAKEPQVAITLNLAPQLQPGGIFIPERIQVLACLSDPLKEHSEFAEEKETERVRIPLGVLFDLRAERVEALISEITREREGEEALFPVTVVSIPSERPIGATQFMLLTHITIFGELCLKDYDSFISSPVILSELGVLPKRSLIGFRYYLRPMPRFQYMRMS